MPRCGRPGMCAVNDGRISHLSQGSPCCRRAPSSLHSPSNRARHSDLSTFVNRVDLIYTEAKLACGALTENRRLTERGRCASRYSWSALSLGSVDLCSRQREIEPISAAMPTIRGARRPGIKPVYPLVPRANRVAHPLVGRLAHLPNSSLVTTIGWYEWLGSATRGQTEKHVDDAL